MAHAIAEIRMPTSGKTAAGGQAGSLKDLVSDEIRRNRRPRDGFVIHGATFASMHVGLRVIPEQTHSSPILELESEAVSILTALGRSFAEESIPLSLELRGEHQRFWDSLDRCTSMQPEGAVVAIDGANQCVATGPMGGRYNETPVLRPFWEVAAEITASVPQHEWDKVPTDLSRNLDHYLYGDEKERE